MLVLNHFMGKSLMDKYANVATIEKYEKGPSTRGRDLSMSPSEGGSRRAAMKKSSYLFDCDHVRHPSARSAFGSMPTQMPPSETRP